MSLTAKMPPPKPRELPKNEMTQAACAFVVDCGQHEVTNDKGEVSLKPKVMFLFELEQKRSDGLPFIMSQTFTNTMSKKGNLRPFLERWTGRGYSDQEAVDGVPLEQFIGMNAYITPVYKESKGVTYANIGSITKIRERDVPMSKTIRELPKWVVESNVLNAKIPPDWVSVKSADSAPADENLPF